MEQLVREGKILYVGSSNFVGWQIAVAQADAGAAWLLHQPAVTAPIIGPRRLEQFQNNLRALDLRLPDETLAALDEIWPGPGGEAPEAYAW